MTLPPLIAGIGCRRGCTFDQVLALLQQALAEQPLSRLAGIASLEHKCAEPALVQLAQYVNLPLVGYGAAELKRWEPELTLRSALSLRHTGCAGVAESTALAHCLQLTGRPPALYRPRLAGAAVTVALAWPV